ncbi:MAG: hypothetical protein BWY80_00736 [Firmicutes bacterium ADurb.Bin456]|nr:MAG: hypothetical protein BWY80_00736 [Firmicutes bacterium ADurb.Bin456]
MAVCALLRQLLFHPGLGGNTGVIGAGHPKGIVALHPSPPGKNVLQGIVQGMSHMQLAGHIWRRHDYTERLLFGVYHGVEKTVFFPIFIPFIFRRTGIVGNRYVRFGQEIHSL